MSTPENINGGGAPTPESAPASGRRRRLRSTGPTRRRRPRPRSLRPPRPRTRSTPKLQRDLEELTAKASKADEYLELAQRTKADFENYRKRAARETAAAQERGVAKLAKELLPAVDNLDRALEAAETAAVEDGARARSRPGSSSCTPT